MTLCILLGFGEIGDREHVKGLGVIAFSCIFGTFPRFYSSEIGRSSAAGVIF